MGDVLTLVEKAEESIKADEADEMTKRIMQQKFDFNDFLKQSQMMSGMGGMGNLTKMLPGLPHMAAHVAAHMGYLSCFSCVEHSGASYLFVSCLCKHAVDDNSTNISPWMQKRQHDNRDTRRKAS